MIPEPFSRALNSELATRRLPVLVAIVFVVLLGRAAADLVWALVPLPKEAQWQPPPSTPAARRSDAVDVDAIVRAHLFGQYQAPAVDAPANAPDTPLDFILMGLLAADDEKDSRALIAQQGGGDEKAYAIGDDITRGVTLQAIFPDRVILSRNGRLETLRLERDRPSPGTASAAGAPAPGPAVAAAPTDAAGAPPLAQIRDEVLKDPAKASEYVRVQPANVNGQLKGYRVYPGRDRSVFTTAGLRPGDLVTSINGVQLDDPAKALQMLGDLTQSSQVTLTVERGGQSQTLSLTLN